MARLSEAVDRYAEAERARAELEREVRCRKLHDGLLVDLRRTYGDLGDLLVRTDTPPAQALTTTDPQPKSVMRETVRWRPAVSATTANTSSPPAGPAADISG
jgi:hypothetical protein